MIYILNISVQNFRLPLQSHTSFLTHFISTFCIIFHVIVKVYSGVQKNREHIKEKLKIGF